MDSPYLVYKNNIDQGGGACSIDADLSLYLYSTIEKFNHKYNKNISFYSTEILDGELLKISRQILLTELEDLLINYHIDADPNGFSRSAMKLTILSKEVILNNFSCKIDQIIYQLNGLLEYFDRTIQGNGHILIYGLGDTDVLDWNLVWSAKKLIKLENQCTLKKLEGEIGYIFRVDKLVDKNPKVFSERLTQLVKKGYLTIENEIISVTEKGQVIGVWKNYITKKVKIDKDKLKKSWWQKR
jgi:hypothetical protein